MRTRSGACYASVQPQALGSVDRRSTNSIVEEDGKDHFIDLPEDMVAYIPARVAATADKPADLISATMSCKRFLELGLSEFVLKNASIRCLAVKAKSWTTFAKLFLETCAFAGNMEASYILGMIMFYCLKSREDGAAKVLAAALRGHKDAIYSLAVIVFNGSGGTREDRDLGAAVMLCASAASMGHVFSLRELGFCLQDGYGVHRSIDEGRRLITLAKQREMSEALSISGSLLEPVDPGKEGKPHVANIFMTEWFAVRPDDAQVAIAGEPLRMCANALCGRQETRTREFRRCAWCYMVQYCSRACQARHWFTSHRSVCVHP